MYDDLIKQLRYCADAITCRNCLWKTECCPTDMQKKAADAIEKLSKRVPPVPHGRLLDADDVYHVLTAYYHHSTDFQHEALKEALARVSTIIGAEGGVSDV